MEKIEKQNFSRNFNKIVNNFKITGKFSRKQEEIVKIVLNEKMCGNNLL